MKAANGADVYRGTTRVGWIERSRHGAVFEYEAAFLDERHLDEGIAIHLPYAHRRVETTGVNLHTYFAGLLPEGLRLRALVKRLKTSEDDLLSLLVAAGADCIGDVAAVPRGAPLEESAPTVDARRLDGVRFAELFAQSIGGAKRREPMIPGVQEKISAAVISFPVRSRKKAGAFILKLNPRDKPRLVENEHFFMRMAAACGLEVAAVKLVHDKDGEAGLLVERFDRRVDESSGAVVRVHQEDACQFLDLYPADKYNVTCADVAEGLSVCDAPVVERLRFVRLVAFSYLVANGDLHAKNVSVLRSPDSKLVLSPAYDVLSTLPYGDRKMAMKVDGRDDNFKRTQIVAFAKRHGVRDRATTAMLDALCERAREWIERVDEIGLDARRSADLRRVMTKRIADLAG